MSNCGHNAQTYVFLPTKKAPIEFGCFSYVALPYHCVAPSNDIIQNLSRFKQILAFGAAVEFDFGFCPRGTHTNPLIVFQRIIQHVRTRESIDTGSIIRTFYHTASG